MLCLRQGEAGFARGDDDALGLALTHLGTLGTNMLRGLRRVVLILAWLPAASGAAGGHLAPARDLAADGRAMRPRGAVMLVLFSQDGCRWCERARREVLLPLQNDPASARHLLLREIALDSDAPMTDFAGRQTTQRRFAADAGARVTPTLMVYGPDGRRLAEPLVGFLTADFNAEYVDRAVAEGRRKLRAPSSGD
jgi:thioredoxin-related protein